MRIPEAFLYGLLWGWFCSSCHVSRVLLGFLVIQPFSAVSMHVGKHGKEKWIPRNAKG